MKPLRFKDYLVVGGGILLIAASLSFTRVNPADSAADETVRVVNTPLPVTLQGTVSGNVTISNTPDVNVVNRPTVNLGAIDRGHVRTSTMRPRR